MRILSNVPLRGLLPGLLLLAIPACETPGPGPGAPPEAVVEGRVPTNADVAVSPVSGERFAKAAVAADSRIASLAGVEIMQAGGNAVDAAIATALTLSVTRPYSCGLGGGGFMIVFDPETGESIALDYRETCPAGVGPSYYVDQEPTASGYDPSRYGGRAVGVPGQIPGMVAAHRRWGSLPLETVVGPAVRAAREGFAVDEDYLRAVDGVRGVRRSHPDLRPISDRVWIDLCNEGRLEIGDVIRQPALGDYLERFGREGLESWSGPSGVASAVVGADRAADGDMTIADIREYQVAWRRPLVVEDAMDGIDAILMPPPSSGGIAIAQILRMTDRRREAFGDPSPGDPAYSELLTGAFRHAFADRARHLADPDFSPVPVEALLEPAAVDAAADRLRPGTIVPADDCGVLPPAPATALDDHGTSHFSVIDPDGMTVACTQTINGTFGSLVSVPSIGVILNNEMNDFTTVPGTANMFGLSQSDRNLPEPGKRPLSSMSPSIIVKDGRTLMTAGASGGPRIITGTVQVMLRVLHGGAGTADAVGGGRIHHQWAPDVVRVEPGQEDCDEHLRSIGHQTTSTGGVGVVQAIVVHEDGLEPASDPRKGGRAAGW
ncbi:MAG: gamma-glutamyltransferase [Phycisphaerae bacterium]|nr:gamma-glutamyltransferase [Phycisphaerae bacterium]